MKIHAIQTGSVKMKTAHYQSDKADLLRMPQIVLDKKWTDWAPIYCWVIEHPEGVIVVDTGEIAGITSQVFFEEAKPVNSFYAQLQLKWDIEPEQEIGPQLQELGINPVSDVWKVAMTHLHFDHSDGIRHLPNAQFYMHEEAHDRAYRGGRGSMAVHWPLYFALTPHTYQPMDDIPVFKEGYPITSSGDVVIVPTPGHTPWHQSVLVRDEDTHVLLAGDTTFDLGQLYDRAHGGINSSRKKSLATLDKIAAYLDEQPTVYLPSHDPESPARLAAREATPVHP